MRPLAVFTRARSTPCCSAIFRPTGTTSPACAVTSRSTPDAGASISTVTLSVSISTIGSPFCTASPGRLSQWTTLPVSCASSSAGMMTFVGIRPSAPEDLAGDSQCPLYPSGVDDQVCDGANRARAECTHAHAAGEQALDRDRRGERTGQLEEHDVGLDRREVELHSGQARQALGQAPGIAVVVGQAFDVVAECPHAAGGDDARLAHGAPHLLLASPRLLDEC